MTPPHSPLPWTVKRALAGDLTIVDAHGIPIIAEDGAITPEDAAIIITGVNNHEQQAREIDRLTRKYDRLCFELNSRAIPLPGEPGHTATWRHERMSKSDIMAALTRREGLLSRDLAAAHMNYRALCEELITARNELNAARRETEEMRERTIEEFAQFIENEPIHSWVPGILAKRIRALAAQPDPHKSMTETLMNRDEAKFWDAADRQDDEQDTGSGK